MTAGQYFGAEIFTFFLILAPAPALYTATSKVGTFILYKITRTTLL